jgi:P2X purinoceptor 4
MEQKSSWTDFLKQLFYYHTVKVVQIRSKKIASFHYFVIAIILAYVIGYAIIWKKGYQGSGDLVGNTSIKVKGNAYLNTTTGLEIWDAEDVGTNTENIL